jgi:hypothetical protein
LAGGVCGFAEGSETMPSQATHETSDADPRLIGCLAAGVAGFLLLAPMLLLHFYPAALQRPPAAPVSFPQPRLELDDAAELSELSRSNEARLATYGWVDRDQQLVHLPIERAMSLTLERGLAGW